MGQVLIDSSAGNYGVAYSEAINTLAGGYVSRDLSGLAKNCAPTYGNDSKTASATTYVDSERSLAIDREAEETKVFTQLLEAYKKNPTPENRAAIYNNPKYAYHVRQRTKFNPFTTEIAVMMNDEAEFFARCAQGTGDIKTAANTLVHNRNKAMIAALRADSVLRQTTDFYGVSSDNDMADTLPDICKTEFTVGDDEAYLTVDQLLEVAGKIDLIEDWVGSRVAIIHPSMKADFLRFNLDTIANQMFVPGNDVIKSRKFEGYAGFSFLTSQYARLDEVLIFEPNATIGRVHWFDRVKSGSSRDTKWQQEFLYQTVEQFKRIDDYRMHKITLKNTALKAKADAMTPFAGTGAVVS